MSQHATTQVASTLYAGLYVFNVNSTVPPLNDPRIKQALSLGLDRQSIARDLSAGPRERGQRADRPG